MGIQGVKKVIVGVRDQERAKRFWTEVAGFSLTTDAPYDDQGNRWVEVTSPDGGVALVLSADPEDAFRFPTREDLPTANFFLYADDVEKTYEELSAKGVEFPAPPVRQPWGWWCMFLDSEGNRFALQGPE
ncbi:putative enzyme related to lactoylglutathione lyase [Thermocatellispora tengchongensis]|uniref:Putative enzyme related to lactoylglutathione lyase n=1 Tax=Thermocatellispora tengchongensis TaxID=1073253 RepID=A0A840NZK4_9ACTN|nr:glyoxalase superfamily protein [Thermocatellispora tengchongensis]MBB5132582.1 putative enzyme related to lactoylglutathione lyase [Thermocatellispora tengchongensis]